MGHWLLRLGRRDLQLEKGVSDLEHEHVWMAVLVNDEDSLDGAPHTKVFIVVLEPLESGCDRRILLWLRLLGGEGERGDGM